MQNHVIIFHYHRYRMLSATSSNGTFYISNFHSRHPARRAVFFTRTYILLAESAAKILKRLQHLYGSYVPSSWSLVRYEKTRLEVLPKFHLRQEIT